MEEKKWKVGYGGSTTGYGKEKDGQKSERKK